MSRFPEFRHFAVCHVLLATCLVSCGCTIGRHLDRIPVENEFIRAQLVFHSDFNLPKQHRLLDELEAQRGQISSLLQLPLSDEPIHVHIFQTAERYQRYMQANFPEFPNRRAFFVETDTRLSVYAFWGDRVAQDLRHEVAHGYLHAVLPEIPLWIDEGLAEYFEVDRGSRGLNRPHVKLLASMLRDRSWRPDLKRLENLQFSEEMSQLDYAESWLWVHFLLETTPQRQEQLQAYLARLRMTRIATPLSDSLDISAASLPQQLIAHLRSIDDPSRVPGEP